MLHLERQSLIESLPLNQQPLFAYNQNTNLEYFDEVLMKFVDVHDTLPLDLGDVIYSRRHRTTYFVLAYTIYSDTLGEVVLMDSSLEEKDASLLDIINDDYVKVGECISSDNFQSIALMDDYYWGVFTQSLIEEVLRNHGSHGSLNVLYNTLWALTYDQLVYMDETLSNTKLDSNTLFTTAQLKNLSDRLDYIITSYKMIKGASNGTSGQS